MPQIRYLHKTREGNTQHISQKSGDILQNMNFSRYYRNRAKFIYGFDPNIIAIYSISINWCYQIYFGSVSVKVVLTFREAGSKTPCKWCTPVGIYTIFNFVVCRPAFIIQNRSRIRNRFRQIFYSLFLSKPLK